MQRFRYFTRIGDIETSTDVDIILKEDNCLLLVNRGNFFVPRIVYARKEQGIVIEKEQEIELKYLPDLLFEFDYLPVYYMGFSKGNMTKLRKDVNELKSKYEEGKATMYVSNGLGEENLKARLFNSPSIELFRLYNN